MNPLKDFSSIIPKFHQFRFRGKNSAGNFTTGKNYTIHKKDDWGRTIYTIDDRNHEHALSLNYFNMNCQLIDTPIELLEQFDDLEDALINQDLKLFKSIVNKMIEELEVLVLIKDDDISEGSHFESEGQFIKTVMFDGKWIAIRQPKKIRTHAPMVESYDTKGELVKKLNDKQYKKIA